MKPNQENEEEQEHEQETESDTKDEKPSQTGITETTEIFRVGPFHVVLEVENLNVSDVTSNCDCSSEIEQLDGILLFGEPDDGMFSEASLECCEHEYAAICRFYHDQYAKISQKYSIEKL
jgi:hypothetical protein